MSIEHQIKMFGIPLHVLQESMKESISHSFDEPAAVAMSILSDAQEEMKFDAERARQSINRAKWVISTYLFKPKD